MNINFDNCKIVKKDNPDSVESMVHISAEVEMELSVEEFSRALNQFINTVKENFRIEEILQFVFDEINAIINTTKKTMLLIDTELRKIKHTQKDTKLERKWKNDLRISERERERVKMRTFLNRAISQQYIPP